MDLVIRMEDENEMDLVIRIEDENKMLQTNEDGSWKYTMYECAALDIFERFNELEEIEELENTC